MDKRRSLSLESKVKLNSLLDYPEKEKIKIAFGCQGWNKI
jgi:hypothetical protein